MYATWNEGGFFRAKSSARDGALPALSSSGGLAQKLAVSRVSRSRRGRSGVAAGEFPPVAATPVLPHCGSSTPSRPSAPPSRASVFPASARTAARSPATYISGSVSARSTAVGFYSACRHSSGADTARSTAVGFYTSGAETATGVCDSIFGHTSLDAPVLAKLEASSKDGAEPFALPAVCKSAREGHFSASPGMSMESFPLRQHARLEPPAYRQMTDFEERISSAAGRAPQILNFGDLRRCEQLQDEFRRLQLKDHFNLRGSPRFHRVGLTFAAKQYPEQNGAFGSQTEEELLPTIDRAFNPRSHQNAASALLQDLAQTEERRLEIVRSMVEDDLVRDMDVKQRQLDMLFLEIPEYRKHAPPCVELLDLLPVTLERIDELREKQTIDRTNARFNDKGWIEGRRMGWLMNRDEVLQLIDTAMLWTRSAWNINCPLGMDRASFCRFILDCGLVDQKLVPYCWAVSLFDSVAQSMACCPVDAQWASTAPAIAVVNRWALVSIFDVLLRQHYSPATKEDFFKQLTSIAQQKLPLYWHQYLPKDKKEKEKERIEKEREEQQRSVEGAPSKAPEREPSIDEEDTETKEERAPKNLKAAFKLVSRAVINNVKGIREEKSNSKERKSPAPSPALSPEEEKAEKALKKVPHWMRPPERPVSAVDTQFEGRLRDRLVSCMLIEPEVLHLVMQYRPAFAELHRCYANDNGHMPFEMLLRLCNDFHLVPNLVSCNLLLTTYKKAQCIEEAPPEEEPEAPSPAPKSSGSSLLQVVGQLAKAPTPAAPLPATPAVSIPIDALAPGPDASNSEASGEKSPNSRRKSIASIVPRKRSGNNKSSPKRLAKAARDIMNEGPARPPSTRPPSRQVKEPLVKPSIFGVDACIETLCRVVFIRLGCYGNRAQQSSGGYARVVWFISYLRCVFTHLLESWKNRSEDQDAERWAPHRQLCKALATVPLQLWINPMPSLSFTLTTSVVQPLPGIGCRRGKRNHHSSGHISDARQSHGKVVPKLAARRVSAKGDKASPVTSPSSSLVGKQISQAVTVPEESAGTSDEKPPPSSENEDVEEVTKPQTATSGASRLTSQGSKSSVGSSGRASSSSSQGEDVVNAAAHAGDPQSSSVARGRRMSAKPESIRVGAAAGTSNKSFQDHWSLEALFEKEGGKPCIVEGACTLCERYLGASRWGNPRCRGCSIVDCLDFQESNHPFRRLVHANPPGGASLLRPDGSIPDRFLEERNDLAPPPLGDLDVHLRSHFGHNGQGFLPSTPPNAGK